ncbi:MAG TPA: SLC13 family permease, partial [Longimicrobiaceae bacterium]|nr:SLC13 family permease [Longimicrobiaceae bacterium]
MQAAQTTLTAEIVLTLAITAGALALFVWNRVRMDVVGIMVMAALIVVGLVTPQEGISGFANEAMITVAAMFVLSAGLLRTGAIDILGKWIARLSGRSELRLLVVTLAVVIPLSAFINNTPVVVVMIPVVVQLANTLNLAPSKLLIPLSYLAIMGGLCTLIGTSTNLLVDGVAREQGLAPFSIFEITGLGVCLSAVGLLYLWLVGTSLLPERDSMTDLMGRRKKMKFFTEVVVPETSPIIGQRV